MLRGLVIVLCAAGCLREPTFNGPRDADGDGGMDGSTGICPNTPNQVGVESVTGGALRVCGPNYHFEFSNVGAHFPYQMDIDGVALMADGARCNDERAIGVGLYPAVKVNGEGDANATGTMAIELGAMTDAIAKVEIDWATNTYTCTGTGSLGARSTFTFFPDGRVHRFDRFTHPAAVSTGGCTVCEAGTANDSFFLTSFTTVAADFGNARVFGATGGNEAALGTQGASIVGGPRVCMETRQRSIAFAWRNLNNVQASSGTRIRAARLPQAGVTGAYAFVYDQLNGQPMITPTTANVLLQTTMLLGGASTCATLNQRNDEYVLTPPALDIARMGMSPTPAGYGLDGIYGGEQVGISDRGFVVPGAAGVPVILSSGAAPLRPFAVWLELGVLHQAFVMTRSFGTGNDWYRFQRATGSNGPTQVIFWFPEGMPAGQTITIDPEGI